MKRMLLPLFVLFILIGCNDDNDSETSAIPVNLSGHVQKGPFVTSTSIKSQELDDNLNPTGKVFETQIEKDNGSFTMKGELNSRYVEIIANGYYYNEVSGQLSSAPITLRSLSEITNKESLNVNVLTSLQSQRMKTLIKNGMKLEEAAQQSQREVLGAFGIEQEDIVSFDQMDISKKGDANAILLAISSILQGDRTEGELTELIAKITADIQADGTLNEESLKRDLAESAARLNNLRIQANLRKRYEKLGMKDVAVPDFYGYLDSDGDGVLNNKKPYLMLEKTALTWEAEQVADTLLWSANFVPVVSIPSGTDWIQITECTEERLIFTLTKAVYHREAVLTLTSPDGKVSKELSVSQKGTLTPLELILSLGGGTRSESTGDYFDKTVKALQVFVFDKSGEMIFSKNEKNPSITNNLYKCYLDLGEREFAEVTVYAMVNSPYDFSSFKGDLQQLEKLPSDVDLSKAENLDNFLIGKAVNQGIYAHKMSATQVILNMTYPVAKLNLAVDYLDTATHTMLGSVESITLKDIYSRNGSFFGSMLSGAKNDLTLLPDNTGNFTTYVYGGSSLNSIIIKTAKGGEIEVNSQPVLLERGRMYNIRLKYTSSGMNMRRVIVSFSSGETDTEP